MGAWIEIFWQYLRLSDLLSHPTWVRGLKFRFGVTKVDDEAVAPHMGAWIEIRKLGIHFWYSQSHPTWVRGLKFTDYLCFISCDVSRTPHGCVD